ncbi:hypothetical protein EJ06DRAFT_527076, partial [Trichodelitschia bisporula]
MTLPILRILRLQVQPGRFWRAEPATGRRRGDLTEAFWFNAEGRTSTCCCPS